MDRVSEAVKKIDELIVEVTRDQRRRDSEWTALRALRAVRRVLTRSEPKKKA